MCIRDRLFKVQNSTVDFANIHKAIRLRCIIGSSAALFQSTTIATHLQFADLKYKPPSEKKEKNNRDIIILTTDADFSVPKRRKQPTETQIKLAVNVD